MINDVVKFNLNMYKIIRMINENIIWVMIIF